MQAVVATRYVDPLPEADARRLFESALDGYVSALDAYGGFIPAGDRARVDEETQGVFGGIGVHVVSVRKGFEVLAVRSGSPADAAGIDPGDLFESAAGQPLDGMPQDRAVALLRGAAGSEVSVVVSRAGVARTLSLAREEIPTDTVRGVRLLEGTPSAERGEHPVPPVGYLRIEQFADTTPADVRDGLASLSARGACALVLDLRQNYGGVVSAAVRVAGLLLPEGATVCVQRRREGGEEYRAAPEPGHPPSDLPLVVLVDESTASASEILAGALQDHGRALLVGERTWGKFLVQTLVPLKGGGIVRLTTARYETPLGRSAQRGAERDPSAGLVPDVRVPLTSASERDALRLALSRQFGPRWRTAPRGGSPDAPQDRQLDAALALLRGGAPPAEPLVRGRW